jgi:hypothetical protein
VAIKTAAQAEAKYAANAGAAGPAWLAGINNTTVDVMGRAVAAIPAAIAGYTQSLQSGAYARAVQASGGTANWKTMSDAKSANYAVGVQAGLPKFNIAIGKILSAMPGILNGLPARGPVGSAQNYARSAAVGQALHAQKGAFKG